MLQLTELFTVFDDLHKKHGDANYLPIYGAGQIQNPQICLIFMNPTAKNVAASKHWNGIRAPWLGTKNVWKLLNKLGLFPNNELLQQIISIKPDEWSEELALSLYSYLSDESIYITNIAKCTQNDAKHLPDSIFKEYRASLLQELSLIKPLYIFSLGNQVSSVLLNKAISVSKYPTDEFEILNNMSYELKIYPTYYPVGQGRRNMGLAINRINAVLKHSV